MNKPLTDGRLVGGRGAKIREVDLGIATSGACLSGLGVRDRATEMVLGGGIPYMDARGCLAGVVFAKGVWNDWMLFLLRKGVPSMVESGLLKVAIWERKLEIGSSMPAAEPGLLALLGRPPEPSDWWLDPGLEARLGGREGGFLAVMAVS